MLRYNFESIDFDDWELSLLVPEDVTLPRKKSHRMVVANWQQSVPLPESSIDFDPAFLASVEAMLPGFSKTKINSVFTIRPVPKGDAASDEPCCVSDCKYGLGFKNAWPYWPSRERYDLNVTKLYDNGCFDTESSGAPRLTLSSIIYGCLFILNTSQTSLASFATYGKSALMVLSPNQRKDLPRMPFTGYHYKQHSWNSYYAKTVCDLSPKHSTSTC